MSIFEVLFLAFLINKSFCFNTTSQRKILNQMLNGYDINDWPNADTAKQTDVKVQLYINSFGSLDAAHMDYHLDLFLRQRWRDRRLKYNAKDLTRITVQDEKMRKKIWKPDTFFENVKDANIHMVTMPNILFRIHPNGDVLYSMRLQTKFTCYMDFSEYPLDSQNCDARISSYANTIDVIKYHWADENPIDMSDNIEIAQYDLLTNKTVEMTYKYVTGNFSGLHVQFGLRRQNGYHILQTYIPTVLIVSISWVSFWLDPNAVPGRVTLGVTTLLTLTTLASGIRQQLPPVSYVKAIDVWVGMCMIMVFGALLEFTFSNWLANRKVPPDTMPCAIPRCLTACSVSSQMQEEDKEMNTAGGAPKPKPPSTYIDHARALDRVCRVLFPSSFFVFNLFYWSYYLTQQYMKT